MVRKWYSGSNTGKLLQMEDSRYTNPRLENFIVESSANALDYQVANANKIHIKTKRINKWEATLTIIDNGRGMSNQKQFEQFFVFGSKSKEATIGDIGFVGVGSHTYITRAKCEFVETRSSNGFHQKIRWSYDEVKEDTLCEEYFDGDFILKEPGTRITLHIRDKEDIERVMNDEYIKDIIRRHWNAVLLGFYGDKHIFVNDEEVEPFLPEEDEHRIRDFKIDGVKYKTLYYKTKKPLPRDWQGVFVVTGKKIITNISDYFRHYPDEKVRDYVYGYIIADGLITITKSSKDGYKTRNKFWREFHQKSAKEWKKFLDRIGCSIVVKKNKKLVEYSDKLSNLLRNPRWKHYKKLFSKTSNVPAKRKCPTCGTYDYHTWDKDKEYYECVNGHLFKKKYTWTRTGHQSVKPPTVKKPTFGISSDESDLPGEPYESFVNGATRQIIINRQTTTYKDAKRSKKSQNIHYKRCLASAMVDEMLKQSLIDEKSAKKDFLELYEAL